MAQIKATYIPNFKLSDLDGLSKYAHSVLYLFGDLNIPQEFVQKINIITLQLILLIFPIGCYQCRGKVKVIHGVKTYILLKERIIQEPSLAKKFKTIPVFFYKNISSEQQQRFVHADLVFMLLLIPVVKNLLVYFYLIINKNSAYNLFFDNVKKGQIIELISVKKRQQHDVEKKTNDPAYIQELLAKLKKWA